MVGRIDADARSEQDLVADLDPAGIEHDAVNVGVEIVANLDAAARHCHVNPVAVRTITG